LNKVCIAYSRDEQSFHQYIDVPAFRSFLAFRSFWLSWSFHAAFRPFKLSGHSGYFWPSVSLTPKVTFAIGTNDADGHFFLLLVSMTMVMHLELKTSSQIFEKFEIAPRVLPGGWGTAKDDF
jgi:hypothetical protein